ncbi:hypothetical protein N657DRAFT_674442 [Parathielavia appendiculata]|uniref:Uncharacterized protein n=1 Tax=Parathielavia appendiculata TaxID=2587402 RepID=A0AAN6TSU5_9PEZI|nr:hypothetical protein N657DRAFT_674442 [Parathielavia appendiculata]
MKNLGLAALTGAAFFHSAFASCCRSNICLRDIALGGADALAECSNNLAVTVTLSAVTVTETITEVQSAVSTSLFTETVTETASTDVLLFTETTTITKTTQTDIIYATITESVTTTIASTAAPVTSTQTIYGGTLTARDATSGEVPGHLTAVCVDWKKYIQACKCAGAVPTTVTVPASSETITVTASDAITTTLSTISSTQTDTVTVTETASKTELETVAITDLATATETITVSKTTTVFATSTPTTIVPLQCKSVGTGSKFWVSSQPFPDGSTRYMNTLSTFIAWQGTSQPANTASMHWTLDSNGFFELKTPISNGASVPYVEASATGGSLRVWVKSKSEVDVGVAAGTWAKIKGCVNAADDRVTMSALGRQNILSCGNAHYMSSGDGKDVRSDCVLITALAGELS